LQPKIIIPDEDHDEVNRISGGLSIKSGEGRRETINRGARPRLEGGENDLQDFNEEPSFFNDLQQDDVFERDFNDRLED